MNLARSRPLMLLCAILAVLVPGGGTPASKAQAQVAAPAVENPDLAEFNEALAAEIREKVERPYEASLKTLVEAYRVSVDNVLKRVTAQGLSKEATALQNEARRFAESRSVPEMDEPGTNVEVAKLRVSLRGELGRLINKRGRSLRPIVEAQMANLRELEKQLTRAQKPEQAQQVRARADELAALIPAPEAAPATGAATPSPRK